MKKSVIITGGGRRIGKGLAVEFGKLGWNVGIIYNKSEDSAIKTVDSLRELGVSCYAAKADISNSTEADRAVNSLFNNFGSVDVLINNAAIYPEAHSLQETSYELWHQTINTNLSGMFYTSKSFAATAKANSRIINIASLGAYKIWKQRIPYNVSKAGVIQFTKALALELAPNIAVNSVSPGTIEIIDEPADAGGLISVSKIPMKRYGKVKDIFDAVYFFATCSLFITGQDIIVDGGLSLV